MLATATARRLARTRARQGPPSDRHDLPRENDSEEDPGEDRVVDVREGVPREEDAEENDVAAAAAVQPSQEKEQQKREKWSPLELDVRDLREPPRHERVHEPGEERGGRICRDVAGEGPRSERGEEHAEQEQEVVDDRRRRSGREEREAEDGRSPEVLRESEGVLRGVEGVRVEEVERRAERLVVVPVEDPRDSAWRPTGRRVRCRGAPPAAR